jgi:hypothetical protein
MSPDSSTEGGRADALEWSTGEGAVEGARPGQHEDEVRSAGYDRAWLHRDRFVELLRATVAALRLASSRQTARIRS